MPELKPERVFVAQVPDVTRGHWNDIGYVSTQATSIGCIRRSTGYAHSRGWCENGDRNSASLQLGSQRLGVLSRVISATSVRPMVRMMVSNVQDFFASEGSIRLGSDDASNLVANMVDDGYLDFKILDIQGEIDYLVVDGTLPLNPLATQKHGSTCSRS